MTADFVLARNADVLLCMLDTEDCSSARVPSNILLSQWKEKLLEKLVDPPLGKYACFSYGTLQSISFFKPFVFVSFLEYNGSNSQS
jgi:hypothetical protein